MGKFVFEEARNDNGNTRLTWRAVNLLLRTKSKIVGVTELKVGESTFTDSHNI